MASTTDGVMYTFDNEGGGEQVHPPVYDDEPLSQQIAETLSQVRAVRVTVWVTRAGETDKDGVYVFRHGRLED